MHYSELGKSKCGRHDPKFNTENIKINNITYKPKGLGFKNLKNSNPFFRSSIFYNKPFRNM